MTQNINVPLTRETANLKILGVLLNYFVENPDVRFTQALFNLGINEFTSETEQAIVDPIYYGQPEYKLMDKYNEESVKTLEKLNGNTQ